MQGGKGPVSLRASSAIQKRLLLITEMYLNREYAGIQIKCGEYGPPRSAHKSIVYGSTMICRQPFTVRHFRPIFNNAGSSKTYIYMYRA